MRNAERLLVLVADLLTTAVGFGPSGTRRPVASANWPPASPGQRSRGPQAAGVELRPGHS